MSSWFNRNEDSEDQWISISDMMSVLMMIFLFIAIMYIRDVINEKDRIKEIAITYDILQNDLYKDLYEEFKNDLTNWNAEIDEKTLSIRFKSPEILFNQGSFDIKPLFHNILANFFPRYIAILTQEKYKHDIEEIRIEGHTSSEWRYAVSNEDAYFYNMELSQDRTRKVLEYVLKLNNSNYNIHKKWVKERLTANGLSSSKLIKTNGTENEIRSRRVEFRVKTNAERRIVKILETEE